MNKKIPVLIFICFMTFACKQSIKQPDVSVKTIDNKTEAASTDNSAVTFACNVIENYYRNMDLGEQTDLSQYVSPEILQLMNTKIELWQYHAKIMDTAYYDYEITVTPFDTEKWSKTDDSFEIFLVIQRYYFNNGRNRAEKTAEKSGISEVLQIRVCEKSPKNYILTDCYNKFDIRFGILDDLYRDFIQEQQSVHLLDKRPRQNIKLEEFIEKYKEEIMEAKKQKEETIQTKNLLENMNVEPASYQPLISYNIVRWARNNFNSNNPSSGGASVPYFDFSQFNNAYDCTNFVSHALLAGGASLHDNGQNGITGTDQWYFRDNGNRSSSWAGVGELYTFLTRSNHNDYDISPYAYDMGIYNASLGDIIQFHNGYTWRHSTIVTKIEGSNIYVTGRTAPGWFNDNTLIDNMPSTKRLLHLQGSYNGL